MLSNRSFGLVVWLGSGCPFNLYKIQYLTCGKTHHVDAKQPELKGFTDGHINQSPAGKEGKTKHTKHGRANLLRTLQESTPKAPNPVAVAVGEKIISMAAQVSGSSENRPLPRCLAHQSVRLTSAEPKPTAPRTLKSNPPLSLWKTPLL